MSETTTIKVSMETRDTLKAMGRKGESYDAILVRLIEHHAKTHPLELWEEHQKIPDIEKEAEG